MRQTDQLQHKIMMTISRLDIARQHPDMIGKTEDLEPVKLISDAADCLQSLMEFRNIIAAMASLKEEPREAVKAFVDEES